MENPRKCELLWFVKFFEYFNCTKKGVDIKSSSRTEEYSPIRLILRYLRCESSFCLLSYLCFVASPPLICLSRLFSSSICFACL